MSMLLKRMRAYRIISSMSTVRGLPPFGSLRSKLSSVKVLSRLADPCLFSYSTAQKGDLQVSDVVSLKEESYGVKAVGRDLPLNSLLAERLKTASHMHHVHTRAASIAAKLSLLLNKLFAKQSVCKLRSLRFRFASAASLLTSKAKEQ